MATPRNSDQLDQRLDHDRQTRQKHEEVGLRRMGLQDLDFVVALHTTCFPSGFFARLGPRFLRRYYRTFLDGPLAAAFVTEKDLVTTGYLVGILHTQEHRRLLIRHHGMSLAWAALLAMAARPWLAAIFLRTRSRRYAAALRASRPRDSVRTVPPRVAVLTHLAVSEEARNAGSGSVLVAEFLSNARIMGCAKACLATRADDRGAGTFYRRRGWVRTHSGTSQHGIHLDYYSIPLS